jgi:hypothetical protein
MIRKQNGNRLTTKTCDCTNTTGMGRPPKLQDLGRSEHLFLRLTPSELTALLQASCTSGESVAAILRNGAALYIHSRGKDGSRRKGEKH